MKDHRPFSAGEMNRRSSNAAHPAAYSTEDEDGLIDGEIFQRRFRVAVARSCWLCFASKDNVVSWLRACIDCASRQRSGEIDNIGETMTAVVPMGEMTAMPGRVSMAKEPQKNGNGDDSRGTGTAVITRTKTQTRRPGMYRVLLLNDDYTPMEFVVAVLRKYFSKGPEEATQIMLHVHQHGVGECGIFTYEVAETKVTQVMDYARKHQHPLQCIMEKK
jgi:ATP-dependent Clp protease adaptor protein ClpS